MCMFPPLSFADEVDGGIGGCILRRRGINLRMDRGIWIKLRYEMPGFGCGTDGRL